jgi:hypothetical protein
MLQPKTQSQRRSLIAHALVLALGPSGMVSSTATTSTTTGVPIITSEQLNLPAAGKITINRAFALAGARLHRDDGRANQPPACPTLVALRASQPASRRTGEDASSPKETSDK